MVIVLCSIARCIIFGVTRLSVRPCDERPPAMYGHFCLVPRVSVHDRYYCIGPNVFFAVGTGHNGDKSERRQQKRRHAKMATLQNGDNSGQNGDNFSQNGDNEPLVKTATSIIGKNGEIFWSERRQSMVKTATVVSRPGRQSTATSIGQNGNSS